MVTVFLCICFYGSFCLTCSENPVALGCPSRIRRFFSQSKPGAMGRRQGWAPGCLTIGCVFMVFRWERGLSAVMPKDLRTSKDAPCDWHSYHGGLAGLAYACQLKHTYGRQARPLTRLALSWRILFVVQSRLLVTSSKPTPGDFIDVLWFFSDPWFVMLRSGFPRGFSLLTAYSTTEASMGRPTPSRAPANPWWWPIPTRLGEEGSTAVSGAGPED